MPDNRYRLELPTFLPTTPDEHQANLREIERWGNTLPLDIPNIRVNRLALTGIRSTSSATNVDWPAGEVCSIEFRKLYGVQTKIIIDAMGSAYGSAIGASYIMAVKDTYEGASTDTDIFVSYFNIASTHGHGGSSIDLGAVGVGVHTFTLRLRASGGTIQCDTNDNWMLKVSEVPNTPI